LRRRTKVEKMPAGQREKSLAIHWPVLYFPGRKSREKWFLAADEPYLSHDAHAATLSPF